jgi:eukaryotic-like serine/threonine-protein kinase
MAVSTQTSRIFAAGNELYDAPIQDCPNCGTRVDVTRFEPLQTVTCPGCNGGFAVKGSIDRFNLESIAGKGGTGLVYQAFDPHLGRKVALKVVRPDKIANEEVLHQMAVEAGVTASINHPNVVRVYSAAKVTGRFLIAMEIINGGTSRFRSPRGCRPRTTSA